MQPLTLKGLNFVIFDLETTGLYPDQGDEIIEVGAVTVENFEITDRQFHRMVNPGKPIPPSSTAIHGIKDADVASAPRIETVLPEFLTFTGNRIWVAQNARFDLCFVAAKLKQMQIPLKQTVVIDTIGISKMLFPYEQYHNLDVIMNRLAIARTGERHRSIDDSKYTAQVLIEFIKLLAQQGVHTLPEIEQCFIKPETLFKVDKPKTRSLFG
jgi:DNA polymerase-3 subunit epsilon